MPAAASKALQSARSYASSKGSSAHANTCLHKNPHVKGVYQPTRALRFFKALI